MDFSLDKSIVTKQLGPMPAWAWGLIGIGAAIAYKSYTEAKRAAKAKDEEKPNTDTGVQLIGGNQTPPVVFQSYTTTITPITVPPGGGRLHPPVASPVTTPPNTTTTNPNTNTNTGPTGQWVTVAKYTTANPPWNSTISGIANMFYKKGGVWGAGGTWQQVWNAPENASLRTRRKDPQYIQPGDQVFVPVTRV